LEGPCGATIINISSVQAVNPSPELLDYATTKAGIHNFTKALAQELAEKGIRVNAVAPGPDLDAADPGHHADPEGAEPWRVDTAGTRWAAGGGDAGGVIFLCLRAARQDQPGLRPARPMWSPPTWRRSAARRHRCRSVLVWAVVLLSGYALMTLPSPESSFNRLRPDQVSGPRHVLTDSAPAPPEVATRILGEMPPTAASRDLAYTRALAAASQRMWAAPDVTALWRTVVNEAVAFIAADALAGDLGRGSRPRHDQTGRRRTS
jgi:hypothetical protein